MARQAFEKKIEGLEALRRSSDPAEIVAALRKALQDRNNYLVSKAAAIAGDLRLEDLTPDLIAAFDRFFPDPVKQDPVKSDPQCWAKNAIAKALKDLGCRQASVFLRGIDYVQLEPVWGGSSDSAITLRGACTLALVDCQLDDLEILTHLADRLADKEKSVRVDAALAIAQFGREEGAPLLRLKLLLGDREPEVIGQCCFSLLNLAPRQALPLLQRLLNHAEEEVRTEAASALAASREPEAIEILKSFWKGKVSAEVRRAILISLGASPLRSAADFLLAVFSEPQGEWAAEALSALASSRFHEELREAAKKAMEASGDAGLRQLFEGKFGR
ncbi:MAG TPA: HEAT repeat domain-containing protein [Bryobacteraceae bacterium]